MKRWTRAAFFFLGLHLGRSPVLDAKISLLGLLDLLQVLDSGSAAPFVSKKNSPPRLVRYPM